MTLGYGNLLTGCFDGSVIPASKADGRRVNAKVRVYREIFDLSKSTVPKNVGDTLFVCRRPSGNAFRGGSITVSATLGSSTLSCGNASTPAKYSAATAYTTVDAPAGFGKAAAKAEDPLTAYEDVYLTIGGATLPSSGLIVIDYEVTAR